MRYHSTRSSCSNDSGYISFESALFTGLAPDGGLYIPETIPQFPIEVLLKWANLPIDQLSFHLLRPYISETEIPNSDLESILKVSFSNFTHPIVCPLKPLPIRKNFYVLELFHGPTFAFKDFALQILGNLFEFFLKRKKGMKINVLGATSGDTGGAAIYGLKGKENIKVFILHPKDRISSVQEAQMTSVLDPNVHNIAVNGTFDDCQDMVKALFSDYEFRTKYSLAAINSINWARILSQTIYYFHSFYQLLKDNDIPFDTPSYAILTQVQYVVPTGNFGDILAGYYAMRMGLPIQKLVIATNANDILDRFLKTGTYEILKTSNGSPKDVEMTTSPAMDILVSSNFERLIWYFARGDSRIKNPNATKESNQAASACVVEWMSELKTKGSFSVSTDILNTARDIFSSHRYYHNMYTCEDDPFLSPTKPLQYILDPHTAVGVVTAEYIQDHVNQVGSSIYYICLSTASPGKFPESVLTAINNATEVPYSIQKGFKSLLFKDIAPFKLIGLDLLPKRCFTLPMKRGGVLCLDGVKLIIQSMNESL